MIQRFAPHGGSGNEDTEILTNLSLTDKIDQTGRAQRRVTAIGLGRIDQPLAHRPSSFNPARIKFSTVASCPSARAASITAV